MPLNLNQFKISNIRENACKSGYFFLLRISQETEDLCKKLRFSVVFLKSLDNKEPFISKEVFFIRLASFVLAQLRRLKDYSFKTSHFLTEDLGRIYESNQKSPLFIFLGLLKALLKGILIGILGAQCTAQKKELFREFQMLNKKIGKRVSKKQGPKEEKSGLFSLLKEINYKKRILLFPLFFRGKKQIFAFFISFFPFFLSSNDRYQNRNSEKNLNQKKKIRLSNKEKNFEKISYEEIGLFPRSFSRVFDRFVKQLFNDVENLVLQEYRFYRYLFLTTVKCFFILLLVPFLVNLLAKNYLVRPLTEYLWNTKQSEIFLNAYQQKHAFSELKYFEEKLYFESLVFPSSKTVNQTFPSQVFPGCEARNEEAVASSCPSEATRGFFEGQERMKKLGKGSLPLPTNSHFSPSASPIQDETSFKKAFSSFPSLAPSYLVTQPLVKKEDGHSATSFGVAYEVGSCSLSERRTARNEEARELEKKRSPNQEERRVIKETRYELGSKINERKKTRIAALQLKTVELAMNYNNQSIQAITNFFADLLSVITFFFLLVAMEIPINISKSFLLEVFFGLDDSKKSLLILLVTDLLVGYHSDGPWAIFFESLFNHYGLPESQTGIFLLVATLPVLLDVLFKYLIFRHLNRASPATVATYHAMIE